MRRVVITGMGAVTPIGNTVEAFAEGLRTGRSGAAAIERFDASQFKTQFAATVKDLDIDALVGRREARRMDLYQIFASIAADEAIADAQLDPEKLDVERVGVIVGSGIGGLRSLEENIEDFATGNGTPRYNPFMIVKMIGDLAAGLISIKYGFRGINYATVSACASGTHSIMNALDYIRLGRNDVIIAGGAEAAITKVGIGGFNAMKALSTRNDDPATASRPYDKDRDGFVLGEGAGILVLEELEHAKARGANIYAEVLGAAATADAHHISATHPEGLGAQRVMELTLEYGGVRPEEVDYVNTHGTSTPVGDVPEIQAVQKVFGEHAYNMAISSTKSMTGHLLGAAGAIETIAGVLAIQHNFIPPTINHFTDDPEIDPKLNIVFNEAEEREVHTVLSNTFGFGGHNAAVLIQRYEE